MQLKTLKMTINEISVSMLIILSPKTQSPSFLT